MRWISQRALVALVLFLLCTSTSVSAQSTFVRGRCNDGATVDIADVIFLLAYLFQDGGEPSCFSSCDFNDDGELNVVDAVAQMAYLFNGAAPPVEPFSDCGSDPTPDLLGCEFSAGCPLENLPPMITSDPIEVAIELIPYSYLVTAIDPDAGDTLTFSLPVAPTGASIDPASGAIEWTPTNVQVGPQDFTVRVTDDGPGAFFDEQSFQVQVLETNTPPTITSMPTLNAVEASLYSYDVEASDANLADTLTHSLPSAPTGATIDRLSGLIEWTPRGDQTGLQSFTVRVTDDGFGNLFTEQSFMVDVQDINQAPTITSSPPLTAVEGQLYQYAAAATDPDPGDSLTFDLLVSPAGSTLDPATGAIEWTPTPGQLGPQGFLLRVADAANATDLQAFTVQVESSGLNQPPSINSTPPVEATELQLYTYDVDGSDPNPGDTLTYSLTTAPTGASIESASGVIAWTPSGAQTGDNSFTVRVTDNGAGMLFAEQSFLVTVTDVNQPPVILTSPNTAAIESVLYSYDLDASDPDPTDTLTYSLPMAPPGATIDATTGLISWTPGSNQTGQSSFTARVTDSGSGNLFAEQQWVVTVSDVNQIPEIVSSPVTTATEELPYTYDVNATDADPGDTLVFSLTTSPSGAAIVPETGVISWTPGRDQTGDIAFTVRVTDDGVGMLFAEQSFTVSVTDVNQTPVITSMPGLTGGEGEPYAYDVEATDPDPGDTLTFSLLTSPAGATINASTGAITWTPSDGQSGANDFTVRAADDGTPPLFDEQAFTVIVEDINHPPVISSAPVTSAIESIAYNYDVLATDQDTGDTLTYSLLVAPLGATIDQATGLVAWTPEATQTGDNDFTVRVTDDGTPQLFVEQSFVVVVADINQPPSITSSPITVATELVEYIYDVMADDPDPTDELSFSLETSPPGATINSVTGVISWTPDATQSGPADFAVRVTDDGIGNLFDQQDFVVTVGDLNQPPTIASTPVLAATEGALYTYDVDASDPDSGDTLTYSLDIAPTGAAIDPTTGLISWTPDATQVGDNDFTVRVTDDGLGNLFAQQSFVVTVTAGNSPPAITSTPPTTGTEGVLYTYDADASDPDSGDTLTYSLDIAPTGAAIDPATGLISWTPDATQVGGNDFTVRVTDDGLGSLFAQQSFVVTVTAGNSPPAFTSTPPTTGTEGVLYTYDADASDPDSGDTLTYSLDIAPTGAAIDPTTGLISWTPDASQVGDNDFTVRVTDDGLGSLFAQQSFVVMVSGSDAPPTITSTAPTTSPSVAVQFEYDVDANDPEMLTITYSLTTAPGGATIDPATGLVSWTPASTEIGDQDFTVRAEDPAGNFDEQNFSLEVRYRVNCGEGTLPYTDSLGSVWPVDFGFDGGSDFSTTDPVAGTADPTLFQIQRFAFNQLTYSLPLPDASYGVRLHFAEIFYTSSGERIFDVSIEGALSLDDYDIVATGGAFTAVVEEFQVTTSGGSLEIQLLEDVLDIPVINAIEVFAAAPLPPTAPTITSVAPLSATENVAYLYDVDADDPNFGDVVTYSLETAPGGASIDPFTGVITWVPTMAQLGGNSFVVRATDLDLLFDEQAFTVTVQMGMPNQPPSISTMAPTAASVNVEYEYDIDATDPNVGDTLTFSLVTAPAGATIDPMTGVVSWTPFGADVGFSDFTVRVEDAAGEFDEQSFMAEVRYRINCGDATTTYVDSTGAPWAVDFGFDSGGDFSVSDPIADTPDATLFQSLRFSTSTTTYSLALPPGTFSLRLYFAEIAQTNIGDRVFDVAVEGSTILDDFDILAIVAPFTALIDERQLMISDGSVEIEIIRDLVDLPVVCAIEIFEASMLPPMAPTITSTPLLSATIGTEYLYDVDADDPNNEDTLTYSLVTAPAGASIDSASGLISWTPLAAQVGANDFVVRVTDDGVGNLSDEQAFTVTAELPAPPEPPVIATTPGTSATVMALYSYDVEATDANIGDTITYSLEAAPTGATIDPATGVIAWTPIGDDVGYHSVIVRATDDGGLFSEQAYTVEARYRINCGDAAAAYVDTLGATWTVDFGFDSGGDFSNPAAVSGTPDPTLFQSLRFTSGALATYTLPVLSDTYDVRLYFAEIFFTDPGERIFDIGLEGTVVLSDYDVVAVAGGGFAAVIEQFMQPVSDGALSIDLIEGLMREPVLNAIEVGVDNVAPTITSTAGTMANVGLLYDYDANASDANAVDFATFTLVAAPAGATINAVTGIVEWTPDGTQLGLNAFTVRATDGGGLFAEESFMVDVSP